MIERAFGAKGQDRLHIRSGPGTPKTVAGNPDPGEDTGILRTKGVSPLELCQSLRHRTPHEPRLVVEGDALQKMRLGKSGILRQGQVDRLLGLLSKTHPPGKAAVEDELRIPFGAFDQKKRAFPLLRRKRPKKLPRPQQRSLPDGLAARAVAQNPGGPVESARGFPVRSRNRKEKGRIPNRTGAEGGGKKDRGGEKKKEEKGRTGEGLR